jgi:hypothetical protein
VSPDLVTVEIVRSPKTPTSLIGFLLNATPVLSYKLNFLPSRYGVRQQDLCGNRDRVGFDTIVIVSESFRFAHLGQTSRR